MNIRVSAAGESATIWTDERIELLRKLWTEGLSAREIAQQLDCGISRCAVLGKANRLDLAQRAPSRPKLSREQRLARQAELAARRRERQAERRARLRAGRLPPEPIVTVTWPGSLNLPLHEVGPGLCRFPSGEGPYTFCGQPTRKASSYCDHCHQIAYKRPQEKPAKPFIQYGWRAA